jgi:hypothetical protein
MQHYIMRKKIVLLMILIPILGIVGFISFLKFSPKCNSHICDNSLNVRIDLPLLSEKLKIYQGFFSINRKSDSEIILNRGTKIYDGTIIKQLENDYGENDFLLIYDEKYYYQFRHFKTNNKQIDSYGFNIYKKSDTIFLKVDIKGTDCMNFTRPFNLISDANKLICNTPIEKAGYMYNMIEMEEKEK